MERLLEVPRGANVHMVAYADDLTIVVVGANSLEEAKQVLGDIEVKCTELGFKINYIKSNIMKTKSILPEENVTIQNRKINWVNTRKILAV